MSSSNELIVIQNGEGVIEAHIEIAEKLLKEAENHVKKGYFVQAKTMQGC